MGVQIRLGDDVGLLSIDNSSDTNTKPVVLNSVQEFKATQIQSLELELDALANIDNEHLFDKRNFLEFAAHEDFLKDAIYRELMKIRIAADVDKVKVGQTIYPEELRQKRKYRMPEGIQKLKWKKKDKKKTEKRPLPFIEMEEVEVGPKFRFCTRIWKNIKVEDKLRFSHIPYFLEHEEEGEQFADQLKAMYPDGVHGSSYDCTWFVNDKMMYELVVVMKKKFRIEEDILYKAIHHLFPNKFTCGELKNIFPWLEERFYYRVNGLKSPYQQQVDQLWAKVQTIDVTAPSQAKTTSQQTRQSNTLVQYEFTKCQKHCEVARRARLEDDKINQDPEGYRKCAEVWLQAHRQFLNIFPRIDYDNICVIANVFNKKFPTTFKSCDDIRKYFDRNYKTQKRRYLSETARKKSVQRFRRMKSQVEFLEFDNPFEACDHDGQCTTTCKCFTSNAICTKYCRCYGSGCCTLQFSGCRCKEGMCMKNSCDCFKLGWECDPDLCRFCCKDVGTDDQRMICNNVNLQHHIQKKVFTAPSTVHGTGAFAGEPFQPGEFVCEYVGEVISNEETDRREIVYDQYKTTFLFHLNNKYSVDAWHKGNIARFVNHSKNPNVQAKIFCVDTEQRIAFFASQKINIGDELFFNYGFNAGLTKSQLKTNRRKKSLSLKEQKNLIFDSRRERDPFREAEIIEATRKCYQSTNAETRVPLQVSFKEEEDSGGGRCLSSLAGQGSENGRVLEKSTGSESCRGSGSGRSSENGRASEKPKNSKTGRDSGIGPGSGNGRSSEKCQGLEKNRGSEDERDLTSDQDRGSDGISGKQQDSRGGRDSKTDRSSEENRRSRLQIKPSVARKNRRTERSFSGRRSKKRFKTS